MEILRRIDKGYRLIEQAKDKSERLMNVESIKRLKHELDLILKEENAIRVQVDQARTGLLIKEKQLSDVDRQLLSILEKLYESEHQNSKILQELKKQEVILKDKKTRYSNIMLGYVPTEIIEADFSLRNFVKISKIDAANSKELPGATLEITNVDDSSKKYSWVSTNTPHAIYLENGKVIKF